jgi:hypothetical protein
MWATQCIPTSRKTYPCQKNFQRLWCLSWLTLGAEKLVSNFFGPISKVQPTNATFSRSICFYKLLYMFQAVPLPIIRSTKLYIQRQVLSIFDSTWHCQYLTTWRCQYLTTSDAVNIWQYPTLSIFDNTRHCQYLTIPDAVNIWQHLTLYVQFCAPDDGWRNRLKHVKQFIEINRLKKRCILLVVL